MSEVNQVEKQGLDIMDIMQRIPHRFPMLLVDKIIEEEPMKRIVGIKNVTINEGFFQGHYPGHPIMPGVLIIEAMAQTLGVLILKEVPAGHVPYFTSIRSAKFRGPVRPGDQLRMEMEVDKVKGGGMMMTAIGKAYVDGKMICEAELMFAIIKL